MEKGRFGSPCLEAALDLQWDFLADLGEEHAGFHPFR
jgi:hypothetical protein